MKFKRLDENSIRCIISQEEMDEHGIGIDDLMDDRNKAETFLRYVLHEANQELNFKTDSDSLNVQLSVMPSGDVSLMISDDTQSALNHMLNHFKDSLKDFTEVLEEKRKEKEEEEPTPISMAKDDKIPSGEEMMSSVIWMEFSDLDRIIRLAKIFPELAGEDTSLFKYKDTYYVSLRVHRPRKSVARLAFSFGEYCDRLYYEKQENYEIMEHGTLLISDDVFQVLGDL